MITYSVSGWNNEPDGRLVLQTMEKKDGCDYCATNVIVIPASMIDELIEELKKHSGSDGDGAQFIIQR